MKIVLDCHYAPSIAWWALAARAEEVVIEQHSYFRKGSYRNRCHIYGANGLLRLSIPLKKGKGQRAILKDVAISYDHDWRKLHWESLCSAYRSSPYFEFYEMEFEALYKLETFSLLDFNLQFIHQIKTLIGWKGDWDVTASYEMKVERGWLDTREVIHPNDAKNVFSDKLELPKYLQVFDEKHGYIPNLSIMDLLFNLGPASLDYLQNQVKITV